MKVAGLIVGLFAAAVVAAPTSDETLERRKNYDLSKLNNLKNYNSRNMQYLNNVNNLDLVLFQQLGEVNNFNVLSFQSLFQNNEFNLQQILALQQIQIMVQFAQVGLFNGFDLSSLSLDSLNLGVVENVGSVDLSQFIQQSSQSQIEQVAAESVVIAGKA